MVQKIRTNQGLLQHNKNIMRKIDPDSDLLKVQNEGKSCIMCGETFKAVKNTRACNYCRQDLTAQILREKHHSLPTNLVGNIKCKQLEQNKITGKPEIEFTYTLQEEKIKILAPILDISLKNFDISIELNNLFENVLNIIEKKFKDNTSIPELQWDIYLKTCGCGCKSPYFALNNNHKYKSICYEEKERKRLNAFHKMIKKLRKMTQEEMQKNNLDGYGPPGCFGTVETSYHRKETIKEEMGDIERMKREIWRR